jgi:hypothetical protein
MMKPMAEKMLSVVPATRQAQDHADQGQAAANIMMAMGCRKLPNCAGEDQVDEDDGEAAAPEPTA